MRQLDYFKEKLAYLRFWQGILVVTDISVAGWFIAAVDDAGRVRVVLALVGIMLLSCAALVLDRRISGYIEEIGKL